MVGDLWQMMNTGGFSAAIAADIRHFNGLFAPGVHGPNEPLVVSTDELDLLILAAGKGWANVEPAIFGTLLENALDDPQRAALGAHFTPRAFVERLVLPTIIEPLLAEWDGVKGAAFELEQAGKREEAARAVSIFHGRLASVRVLDPACGSGNFLYVAMELMKRLEGEVLDLLATLRPGEGDRLALAGATVDPHNFLGLEKNPRAVPVAELVLWIGWLQWHTRTAAGRAPPEPILKNFRNVREADALLTYADEQPDRDARGNPVTRWGGRTKLHPITGEKAPDETDRVLVLRPVGGKPAQWPEADFIVGNPPFIGAKRLRETLGEGYVEALWHAYPKIPKSVDLVMFWWDKAARLLADKKILSFGFITSNSLPQFYNRRVVARALSSSPPIGLAYAIPDHPWTQGENAAAVRISMTICRHGKHGGRLQTATGERIVGNDTWEIEFASLKGPIAADLSVATDTTLPKPLQSNRRLCWQGCKLVGSGFQIKPAVAAGFLRQDTAAHSRLQAYWSGSKTLAALGQAHEVAEGRYTS